MSGTNGSGVMDGVNGSAASALAGQLGDARDDASYFRRLAEMRLMERNRLGSEVEKLAAELADVKAECCRLTDEAGDLKSLVSRLRAEAESDHAAHANLAAAHERLMRAAWSVIRSGVVDGGEVVIAAYWFDRLAKAVNGDLIDPPCSRLTEAIKRLNDRWTNVPTGVPVDAEVSDVLEAWHELGEGREVSDGATPATHQPIESVNARLLAAAKAVCDSWNENMDEGNYDGSRTEVEDEAMEELEEAVDAAQEGSQPSQPTEAINGVSAGQIVREQSERMRTLELERDNALDANSDLTKRNLALADQVAALGRVEAAARDFRLAWRSGETLQTFYDALDFALDGLPKGGEVAPCHDNEINTLEKALQVIRRQDKAMAEQSRLISEFNEVASVARVLRSEYMKFEPNLIPLVLHQGFKSLGGALGRLSWGQPAPCEHHGSSQTCGQPCGQSCPPQVPCPERVHMLAVAARNLIIAKRQGRLTQCEINTLDFALDGLI